MSFHDDFVRAIREKKLVAVTVLTDDKGRIFANLRAARLRAERPAPRRG